MLRPLWLVPLLALLLVGCAPQLPALSPEAAVRRSAQQQPDDARTLQVTIYGSRPLDAGVLVLYGVVRELDVAWQPITIQSFGYSVAERAAVGWRSTQGAGFGGTGPFGAVTYQSSAMDAQRTIVYGHLDMLDAALVEVTWDTG